MHLVGVRDEEGALGGAVVIQHVHDLHCRVCFACAGWAHHHGQPWLRAGLYGLHLAHDVASMMMSTFNMLWANRCCSCILTISVSWNRETSKTKAGPKM